MNIGKYNRLLDASEKKCRKLKQQNAALVEALEVVEWVKGYDPKGIPAPLYYLYCPWCKGIEHSSTCVREQALALAEGE